MWSGNLLNRPINPHHIHQNLPLISNNYPPPLPPPSHSLHPQPQPQPPPPLASDYDTRLRDEVLYLHSLWHRGPPSQPPHGPTTPLFLRPLPSTHFKKPRNKKPISDKEWPVPSIPTSPSPTVSSWPDFKPLSKPVSRPATAEEKDRVLGVKIHLKGLDLCSGLVRGPEAPRDGGDDDDDDNDDDDDDDDEDEMIDDAEEYEYLMKMFEENNELREFYVNKCENGEFYCLICGVLVNQLRKKYKNCVALIQHCVTISKTKKKAAHRALGHVICKLLGWDVNRLPSLPLTTPTTTAQSSSEVQRENKNNADGHVADENQGLKTDEVCQNSESVQHETNAPCVPGGESVDCRSSLAGDAAK